jgi:FO synthase
MTVLEKCESTAELLDKAASLRDSLFGNTITYSPKAFFPLTMLCRDRCGYCTFAKAPSRVASPYMELEEVRSLAKQAVNAGVREALFTLGERPEERYRIAREFLDGHGVGSTIEYLAQAAKVAMEEQLLPHINAGTLSPQDIELLRPVSVSMGIMLETFVDGLSCHRLAPDKAPDLRLATLEALGKAKVPTTTGLLVGIGDSEEDRLVALQAIAELHERYHHIQEVIIQNFLPKPGTNMSGYPAANREEFLRTIAIARLVLPGTVSIQAPPNLFDEVEELLAAGINDLGGISPITVDHVNPERPWPSVAKLEDMLSKAGFVLRPRLALYPAFVIDKDQWAEKQVHSRILYHEDQDGYARDNWFAGLSECMQASVERIGPVRFVSRTPSWLYELAETVRSNEPAPKELLTLALRSRGMTAKALQELANELNDRIHGNRVSFVINRNINYTNICGFKCRFCAFSKGPLSLNLRGKPYLLTRGQILEKVEEAWRAGATEVCLQGGIHPEFDAEYYLELVSAIHQAFPEIHIHAFSALEVFQAARRSNIDLRTYLEELHRRGLRTLPGTAAEILHDDIRRVICPDKLSTSQWLEVHQTAHEVGLKSNVTIMFGTIERVEHIVAHFERTRELAERTGGFTEFVPLPFVHMGSPIFLQGKSRRGPTLTEAILMHAVGRIAYFGVIDNIQASWVKMGPIGATILLDSGANDLGGTLMEENISHAAGADHPSSLAPDDFARIARASGKTLYRRNTTYSHLERWIDEP